MPTRSGTSAVGIMMILASFVLVPGTLMLAVANGQAAGLAGGLAAVGLFVGGNVLIQQRRKQAALEAEQEQRAFARAQWEQARAYEEQQRLHGEQQRALEEQQRRERHRRLAATFGHDGATSILEKKLWLGAPEAAAVEIYGDFDEVEERILKTKSKRILKYRDVMHAGRYSVKVTIENGVVVGWEDKDA